MRQKESQFDRVARLYPDVKDLTPEGCLNLLPSVYQSIGTVAMLASRCNPDSKLGKKRWELHIALNNYGVDLTTKIRYELNKDLIGKWMRGEINEKELKEEIAKRKGKYQ